MSASLPKIPVCLVAIIAIGPAVPLPAQENLSNLDQGQIAASSARSARIAPLGLPRLRGQVQSGEAAPLAATAFVVDALDAASGEKSPEGLRAVTSGSARVVEIDAEKEWSRPLQKFTAGILFVSFSLYGSPSTLVVVGGARLGLIASPFAGDLQLMVGEPGVDGLQWRPIGVHVPLETYQGRPLAGLPVITVRLDAEAGTWDLYSGPRQLADGLALNGPPDDVGEGRFLVRGGSGGAWIGGLVQSADNPLFEDANGNGIDDAFEREKKGQLLAHGANVAERRDTAKQWRDDMTTRPPAAWLADRPRPDRLTAPAAATAEPKP